MEKRYRVRVDGSLSTDEEFETDQRISLLVAGIRTDYLNGLRSRPRPQWSDHGPIDIAQRLCLSCGVDEAGFHASPSFCRVPTPPQEGE